MRQEIPFESEFALHTITQKHLKELFDVEFVASEIQLNDLRLDNLAFDLKTNSFVIIEYKNELNLNVINQAREYYELVRNNQEFFTGRLDNGENVDFENTRVMIIGPKFSAVQIESDFEVWKITLFDDGEITYENMKTGEIKSIKISLDELKLTEETLLEDKSEEMKDLYINLKDKILNEFSDVDIKFLVGQVAFKVNGKLICVVVFLKSSFNIYFYGSELENSEKTTDISDKSTGGNANYRFKYHTNDDFDYFLNLFRQIYLQKV